MPNTTDLTELAPVAAQNPRVKQYLSIKKNTRSNPENLVCLEGLWEISTALDAGLALRAFFVCPELLRGDAGKTMAQRIAASSVPSYAASSAVMQRLVDREGTDGLAADGSSDAAGAGTTYRSASRTASSCSTGWR